MNIGIFGLGYVGIVNVACLSKAGNKVWCTDIKPSKVQQVREGLSPIKEPQVEELIQSGINAGTIIPLDTTGEVIANADILLICVGTPSKPDGEVNLDYLMNVISEIAANLNPADKKFIVFRSTVPPGTTKSLADMHLTDKFPGVTTVFYPEFLREGSAVRDFSEYDRFVLGTELGAEVDSLVNVLHVNPRSQVFITDYRTAEYAKYVDNGFHALKVAFANEIFGLAASQNVDVEMAHKIFVSDNKLNISALYLKPGLPFGGSCLPKDLRETQYLIKHAERDFPLLKSVIPSNESFIKFILQKIVSLQKTKISFIGLTFKNHSDDLRESPVLKILLELQKQEKYEIKVFDDDLKMDALEIDNPSLYSRAGNMKFAVEDAEILVVSKRYLPQTLEMKTKTQILLNLADLSKVDKENNVFSIY